MFLILRWYRSTRCIPIPGPGKIPDASNCLQIPEPQLFYTVSHFLEHFLEHSAKKRENIAFFHIL